MTKFSVEDLEEFQRLKKRQRQLLRWRESIKEDLARLKDQQRHQEEELASVEEVLGGKYQALEGKLELFTLSDVPDSALQRAEGKKNVSSEKKKLLLPIILNDYLKEDPEADSVPFRWIKARLENEYKIKCRSISNFFIGILDDYELVGGNRNKAVKLKK